VIAAIERRFYPWSMISFVTILAQGPSQTLVGESAREIARAAAPGPMMESVASGLPTWLSKSAPFTPIHFVSAGTGIAFMIALCWWGMRTLRQPGDERRERAMIRSLGWIILATQIAVAILWATPRYWDVTNSLPLQICDLAGFIAAAACLTEWRWTRVMLLFWGIGLSTQAFITPVVVKGIDTFDYWQFWINHTQIVGVAFYFVIVRGYRPTKRDWLIAIALTHLYVAFIIPLNLAIGANYGYVGRGNPRTPTVIDKLEALGPIGQWPWRLFPMALMVTLMFTMLWQIVSRIPARSSTPVDGERVAEPAS
jgi:hypothetical integral membrane protein (TIGR02206 family)